MTRRQEFHNLLEWTKYFAILISFPRSGWTSIFLHITFLERLQTFKQRLFCHLFPFVCLSISLYVRSHATTPLPLHGLSWNVIFEYFYKICQENSRLLNLIRITGTLLENQCTFMITCRLILVRVRNISDKVVQKVKIHILCSPPPPPENRAVYGIIWKDSSQMTKYRTCTLHDG